MTKYRLKDQRVQKFLTDLLGKREVDSIMGRLVDGDLAAFCVNVEFDDGEFVDSIDKSDVLVDMKAVIFDIDGTLADASHRRRFLEKSPKDWNSFYEGMDEDEVIEPVEFLLMCIKNAIYFRELPVEIIFCTGRPERYREITEQWLSQKLDIYNHRILMRKEGDFRADDIVKQEMLDQLKAEGFEVFLVFDDRQRVVDMWRRNGIQCCQVAPGDF